MRRYKDIIRKYQLKPLSYSKQGNVLILDTKDRKYVIKEKIRNPEIYDYLNSRSFNYYPQLINDIDDNYEISEYLEEQSIPEEQKLEELMKLTALLHSKTTYYQKSNLADNKEIYETLVNNIAYLKSYYEDMIIVIDNKEFMSPAEYLFARNFSKIMDSLMYCENKTEVWYKMVENTTSERTVVIHNNLSLDHFIYNQDKSLLSWRKSKFGKPIFDLVTIYNRYGNKYDFEEKLALYETIYPLKEDEKELLYIMISMPPKIEFKGSCYELCKEMYNKIELLYKKDKLILPNNFEDGPQDE